MWAKLEIIFLVSLCVLIPSCKSDDQTPSGPSENTVLIMDNFFSPSAITVAVGRIVVWRHQGVNDHTVTSGTPGSTTAGSLFDSGTLRAGGGFTYTFSKAGTYNYFCRIHGSAMTGVINVR